MLQSTVIQKLKPTAKTTTTSIWGIIRYPLSVTGLELRGTQFYTRTAASPVEQGQTNRSYKETQKSASASGGKIYQAPPPAMDRPQGPNDGRGRGQEEQMWWQPTGYGGADLDFASSAVPQVPAMPACMPWDFFTAQSGLSHNQTFTNQSFPRQVLSPFTQQIPQGAFWPTPPYSNAPYSPPTYPAESARSAPQTAMRPPTPPRTNPPREARMKGPYGSDRRTPPRAASDGVSDPPPRTNPPREARMKGPYGSDRFTPPRTASGGIWNPTPKATNKARKKAMKKDSNEREAIVPPSAASGGIPDPTPAYLIRASFLPMDRPRPQPLLVVIDLNGTILYRPSRRNPANFVARPHALEFLAYCLDTFYVVFWSSARTQNVANMCNQLLKPHQLRQVIAMWSRDHFGLTHKDYQSRVQCYKRLTRLWNDPLIQASYPSSLQSTGTTVEATEAAATINGKTVTRSWDQGNTILIDDSAEKARSEPFNLLQIPEFLGTERKEHGAVLPQVHDYLNTLACQADVSTYVRVHPFRVKGNDEMESSESQ